MDSVLPGVGCDVALGQFVNLQRFLASDETTALIGPRDAIIPLVPNLDPNCTKDFYTYHAFLMSEVGPMLSKFPEGTRFSIVGYSQGGIAARLLLDQYPALDWLDRVILAGTPNAGSCVAHVGCSLGLLPYCLLTPPHMALFNEQHTSGHGKPFFLLAGTEFKPLLINDCLAATVSDGYVSVDSVFYLDWPFLDYQVIAKQQVATTHSGLVSDPASMALLHGWLK